MKLNIYSYDSFITRLEEYNFKVPNGISFIPFNINSATKKEDLVYLDSAKSLKKLWRLEGIEISKIELEEEKPLYLHQRNAEWIAPTIFIGYSLLSENQHIISVALSIIANYATDLFKGKPSKTTFKMELIIEEKKDSVFRKLSFEGEPHNITEVIKAIRELKK